MGIAMNVMDVFRSLAGFSWDKEEWFVPLATALEGVGAAEAAWQPPGGGNTIWQTVNHLNYWNGRMLGYLTGVTQPKGIGNDATFGEPGDPANAAGWADTLELTRRVAEQRRAVLAELTDADLSRALGSGTVGEALPSWLLHDAYHTGQIVLLRKQQGSWREKQA